MAESSIPMFVQDAMRRQQSKKRRIRRVLIGMLVVPPLLLAVILASIYFYNRHQAERALEEAIAETDRLDAHWRLEDIDKRRLAFAREENAAIHIIEAAVLIPKRWPPLADLETLGDELPQYQLDPAQAELLRKTVEPLLPAVASAQKAAPLKSGSYYVVWADDGISTLLPHLQEVRNLCNFLSHLAMLQSQDGKHDEALQTTLLIMGATRSLGDEPTAISQLVRMFGWAMAIESLERCLAQGKVTDELLAQAQEKLLQEAAEPILYYAMRGERAMIHCIFNALEAGQLTNANFSGQPTQPLDLPKLVLQGNTSKADHAWVLKHMNDVVHASNMIPPEQLQRFKELENKTRERRGLASVLLGAYQRIAEASVRTLAKLNCATAGIGVERFRLKHNRWPDSLDEVVAAKLLDKVPDDPYDGKPLRYRKTKDGVVVYSIGLKGDYGGDALDKGGELEPNVTRYEFRLWDETHRRQPPRPRPKIDEKKDEGGY